VVVGGDMTVPGHPEVIVIGDVAHTTGPGGDALPGLAPVAIQQGKHAAAVVRARIAGEPLPTFTFRDRGTMATIGRGAAVARVGRLGFDGALAWLAWLAIHLVYLVGFEHRAIVLVRWLWTFFTQRRPSLILTGQMLPPDVPEPRLRAAVGRWVEEETGGAQPVTSRAGALPPQLETIETDGR
jgi:NADH dehydrogenase